MRAHSHWTKSECETSNTSKCISVTLVDGTHLRKIFVFAFIFARCKLILMLTRECKSDIALRWVLKNLMRSAHICFCSVCIAPVFPVELKRCHAELRKSTKLYKYFQDYDLVDNCEQRYFLSVSESQSKQWVQRPFFPVCNYNIGPPWCE